jgi:hypothetical protein
VEKRVAGEKTKTNRFAMKCNKENQQLISSRILFFLFFFGFSQCFSNGWLWFSWFSLDFPQVFNSFQFFNNLVYAFTNVI